MLVASIFVIGLQETSRTNINVADDFKRGFELQNVADSALFEAIEKIKSEEIELKEIEGETSSRTERQDEIPLSIEYDADVKVIYEYAKIGNEGNIWFVNRSYSSGKPFDSAFKKVGEKFSKEGVVLISVASRKIEGTTIYRRSMAYVLTEDNYNQIYFMNSLNSREQ